MAQEQEPRENAASDAAASDAASAEENDAAGIVLDSLAQAQEHLKAGRKAQAVRLLKALVDREPENAAAFEDLAAAFFRSGRYQAAADSARRALSLDPSLHRPHGILAWIAVNRGDLDEAQTELLAQLQAVPAEETGRRASVHNQIGYLHFRQQQYPEAEQALRQALALAPDRAVPRLNLASVYMRCRQNDEARVELEQLLDLPDVRDEVVHNAHISLGQVYARLGRYADARKQFGNALALRRSFMGYVFWAVPFLARYPPISLVIVFAVVFLVLWTWWWFIR
jgi:Flp pilus assembly protein TadD